MILEVLSPSTEAYDRSAKFGHYRRLESLRDYALVSQNRMRVEHFVRHDGEWRLSELTDPPARLRLASIACDIPLAEIYRRIEF